MLALATSWQRATGCCPRLDGVPHLNKPPLHAWLIALASWPMGAVTQWTASVPSVFRSAGGRAGDVLDGAAAIGAEDGAGRRLTVLTTLASLSSPRVHADMTFSAATTTAMAAFIAFEVDGRRGALVLFYGLVGMAFWTKGPAGLLSVAVAAAYAPSSHTARRAVADCLGAAVLVAGAFYIFLWAALVVEPPTPVPSSTTW